MTGTGRLFGLTRLGRLRLLGKPARPGARCRPGWEGEPELIDTTCPAGHDPAVTTTVALQPVQYRFGNVTSPWVFRPESPHEWLIMKISLKKLDLELPTPQHAHDGDGGVDLYARASVRLEPGGQAKVPTGIAIAIPNGYAGFVVPRSGLAAKHGVGVTNGPGLIDAGYRGEVAVLLVNHGADAVDIARGDRVAQLVVVEVARQDLVVVDELPDTNRGAGGFGSTGS